MRFMMFIKVDQSVYASADEAAAVEAAAAMGRYNEELTKAGVLLALDGLHPASDGVRITFGAGGKANVVDGPFAEAKEIIGGYWIIDVTSRDEAIEWAKRVPADEGQAVELRQIFDVADYDPAVLEAHGELSAQPPHQTAG